MAFVVVKFFVLIQHLWNCPFLGILGLISPNTVWSCWDFDQRHFSNKTNTVFEKSLKIMNFGSNEIHPKFTVPVHFRAQFTARKPKILLKTKISGKTTSLGISNNVIPRSQKDHRILVTLSKSKHFSGPNLWIVPWGHMKGLSKILT